VTCAHQAFLLAHLDVSWNRGRSLAARNNPLVHPLLEVAIDFGDGIAIKTSHPAVVHLELLLCALIADGLELAEALTGSALLGLGVVGEWFIGVDEVFGAWVLIDDLICVDADTEGEVFIEEDRLWLSVAVFGLGVGRWKVAGQDRLVKAAARYTLSRLDADVRGDVILPALLLLHVIKVKCGLISCNPLNRSLFLLRALRKVSLARCDNGARSLPIGSRTVHHP
jgi:hypothetical protein